MYNTVCPRCNRMVMFPGYADDRKIDCPDCGRRVAEFNSGQVLVLPDEAWDEGPSACPWCFCMTYSKNGLCLKCRHNKNVPNVLLSECCEAPIVGEVDANEFGRCKQCGEMSKVIRY